MDHKTELGAELKRLREDAGLTQMGLAVAAGYASSGRSMISKAERAVGELLSPAFTEAIDRELGAGGRLVALRAGAWRDEQRGRVGAPARTLVTRGAVGASGQGDTTDRRGLLVAAGAVTATEAVRALVDRVATADPSPLTVAEIGAGVQRAAEAYEVTPRAEMRARLAPEHLAVEALLDRRLSRPVRDELTVYAGMYCYYLGWLAWSTGDDAGAQAYLAMAEHHAAESPDALLTADVAYLRVGLAPLATEADLAASLRRSTHPYVAPLLAANEARAAARTGQPARARAALADMEAGVWAGSALPGPVPFDEENVHCWSAIVLAQLGEGEAAEGHARSSLALLEGGTDKPFHLAGTLNALGAAFARRRTIQPEAAAAAAAAAVEVAPRNRSTLLGASRTARHLARWANLPAVRELNERIAEASRAWAAMPTT